MIIDPLQYPEYYHPLIASQQAIGWGQLFRGRPSNLWSHLHNEIYCDKNDSERDYDVGATWIKKATLSILDSFFLLWEARNTLVHGKDASERTQRRKERLKRELIEIHQLRSEVMMADLIWFIAPTADDDYKIDEFIHTHGPSFIQNWIYLYKPLFLLSVKSAKKWTATEMHSISHYFHAVQANRTRRHRRVRLAEVFRLRATSARPRRRKKKPPDLSKYPKLPKIFHRVGH